MSLLRDSLLICSCQLQDDIYFASQVIPQENNHTVSNLTRRHANVKYRNTLQTHAPSTSEQQIRIYKMSLNSIQKISYERSPKTHLPDIRTPLSPFQEASFDFPCPVVEENDSSVEESKETQPKSSMSNNNLDRPCSWMILDESRFDAEFRDLIECHQGEINCI